MYTTVLSIYTTTPAPKTTKGEHNSKGVKSGTVSGRYVLRTRISKTTGEKSKRRVCSVRPRRPRRRSGLSRGEGRAFFGLLGGRSPVDLELCNAAPLHPCTPLMSSIRIERHPCSTLFRASLLCRPGPPPSAQRPSRNRVGSSRGREPFQEAVRGGRQPFRRSSRGTRPPALSADHPR